MDFPAPNFGKVANLEQHYLHLPNRSRNVESAGLNSWTSASKAWLPLAIFMKFDLAWQLLIKVVLHWILWKSDILLNSWCCVTDGWPERQAYKHGLHIRGYFLLLHKEHRKPFYNMIIFVFLLFKIRIRFQILWAGNEFQLWFSVSDLKYSTARKLWTNCSSDGRKTDGVPYRSLLMLQLLSRVVTAVKTSGTLARDAVYLARN